MDNTRSTSIVGLTEEFVNLEILSLINVGLTRLKGFPRLPNLRRLELSDNRITGGLHLLNGSPKLTHLNLSGNKIRDLDTLEPLKEFKQLKSLDLFNCDVNSIPNYRERMFKMLPSLKYLDGFDKNEKEAEDSDVDDDDEYDNGEDDDPEDDFIDDNVERATGASGAPPDRHMYDRDDDDEEDDYGYDDEDSRGVHTRGGKSSGGKFGGKTGGKFGGKTGGKSYLTNHSSYTFASQMSLNGGRNGNNAIASGSVDSTTSVISPAESSGKKLKLSSPPTHDFESSGKTNSSIVVPSSSSSVTLDDEDDEDDDEDYEGGEEDLENEQGEEDIEDEEEDDDDEDEEDADDEDDETGELLDDEDDATLGTESISTQQNVCTSGDDDTAPDDDIDVVPSNIIDSNITSDSPSRDDNVTSAGGDSSDLGLDILPKEDDAVDDLEEDEDDL